MGRKALFDKPMTGAEKQRRYKAALKNKSPDEIVEKKKKPVTVRKEPTGLNPTVIPVIEQPAKSRRTNSNSADAMISAMVNASLPALLPPFANPITESALPFWNAIIPARARDDWNEPDLILAAQLAQVQADLHEENEIIREEGRVTIDYLGKVGKNPRFDVAEILSKRSLALMRSLHMGGKSGAMPRDFAGARTLEGSARKLREEIEQDDGLLAI